MWAELLTEQIKRVIESWPDINIALIQQLRILARDRCRHGFTR